MQSQTEDDELKRGEELPLSASYRWLTALHREPFDVSMRSVARSITLTTSAANSDVRDFCSRRFAFGTLNHLGSRYSSSGGAKCLTLHK